MLYLLNLKCEKDIQTGRNQKTWDYSIFLRKRKQLNQPKQVKKLNLHQNQKPQ